MSEVNYQVIPQTMLLVEAARSDKERDRANVRRDNIYLELGRRIVEAYYE